AGIELARWFAAEAVRIYAMVRESDEERLTRKLVEFIALRGGGVSVRQLQRANSRRWPSSDLAEQSLDELAPAGLGRREVGAVPDQGGHSPRGFVLLHPTSDTSDTRPADDTNGDGDGEGGSSDTRSDTRSPDAGPTPWESDASISLGKGCGTGDGSPESRVSE